MASFSDLRSALAGREHNQGSIFVRENASDKTCRKVRRETVS
jgi:hypothetical protein